MNLEINSSSKYGQHEVWQNFEYSAKSTSHDTLFTASVIRLNQHREFPSTSDSYDIIASLAESTTGLSGANNEIFSRKIKKEVVNAFEFCDKNSSGILDYEQFEELMILMGFFTVSQSSKSSQISDQAFALCAELSGMAEPCFSTHNSLNTSALMGNNNSFLRIHSDLRNIPIRAVGTTMTGILKTMRLIHGLDAIDNYKVNELLKELKILQMMNKNVKLNSTRRSTPSQESNYDHKPRLVTRPILLSTPESREIKRSLRWENVLSEVENTERKNLTFKPNIGPPPVARIGDRIRVQLFDVPLGASGGNAASNANNHHRGGEYYVKGYVTSISRDGSYDIRCDDNKDLHKIPPARVRKIKDDEEGDEYSMGMSNSNISFNNTKGGSQAQAQALHDDVKKDPIYRRVETRSTEQLQLEKCTFTPSVIGESPFVSERTLRKLADSSGSTLPFKGSKSGSSSARHGSSSRRRKSPKRRSTSATKTAGNNSRKSSKSPSKSRKRQHVDYSKIPGLGGMYIEKLGLVSGPPTTAGIPMYYYDPHNPPMFERHTCWATILEYHKTEIDNNDTGGDNKASVSGEGEGGEGSDGSDEGEGEGEDGGPSIGTTKGNGSSLPAAPELPAWATSATGDPSRKVVNKEISKIVIVKKVKKEGDDAPAAASGWQAIMDEMNARKNGTKVLKKAEVKQVARPPPKKKTGGGGGFGDMMDELKFALSRMKSSDADDASAGTKAAVVPPAVVETDIQQTARSASVHQEKEVPVAKVTASSVEDEGIKDVKPATPAPKNIPSPPALDESKFPPAVVAVTATPATSIASVGDNMTPKKLPTEDAPKAKPQDGSGAEVPATIKSEEKNSAKKALMEMMAKRNPSANPPKPDNPGTEIAGIKSEEKNLAKKALMDMMSKRSNPNPPKAAAAAEVPAIQSEEKNLAKKALMDMMAKRSNPNPVVAEQKQQPANLASGEKAATAAATKIKAPPPLPNEWPPVGPFIAPKGSIRKKPKKLKSKSTKSKSISSVAVPIRKEVQLTTGYYSPVVGLSDLLPGHIKPGGVTTQQLINSINMFIEMQAPAYISNNNSPYQSDNDKFDGISDGTRGGLHSDTGTSDNDNDNASETQNSDGENSDFDPSINSQDNKLNLFEDKIGMGDLPLPSDYYGSIKRLRHAQEVREKARAKASSLEFRNYVEVNTRPESPKKLVPTVPAKIRFSTDERFERKDYSFRKPVEMSALDKLPLDNHMGTSLSTSNKTSFNTCLERKCDVSQSYWISNLRNGNSSSNTATAPSAQQLRKHRSSGYSYNNINAPPPPPPPSDLSHLTDMREHGDLSVQPPEPIMTKGGVVKNYGKSATKPKTPVFNHEILLEKRLSKREEVKLKELKAKEEELERLKRHKESLRAKALKVAQGIGAYNPDLKQHYSYHDKMIAKYSMVPTVGVDIAHNAMAARMEYSSKHSHVSMNSSYTVALGASAKSKHSNYSYENREFDDRDRDSISNSNNQFQSRKLFSKHN